MTRFAWIYAVTLGALSVAAVSVACSSSSNKNNGGSTDAGQDVTVASNDGAADAGVGLTCFGLILCDQKCGSSGPCADACYADATGVAQGLFDAFNNCIQAVCADSDASDCDQVAATGPQCGGVFTQCTADNSQGPPDPDGGAIVVPSTDAGATTNCGQYKACVAACELDAGTDDGGSCSANCAEHTTLEAKALANVLDSCLAMACPSTDGGPCAMPGLACNGCVVQVELAEPDTCAAPYIACNSDTSNLADGGATPTVLVDGGVLTTFATGLDQAASSIVASNGYIYFTQVLTDTPILRIPIVDGGGVYSPVGPPQPTPVGVAVDANNAYGWNAGTFMLNSAINNGDGAVIQVPLDGGAAITLASNVEVLYDAPYLNSVAVDATDVYWVAGANGDDGAIMHTPIGSATPSVLYGGQQIPMAVVSDGTNVYWTDLGTYNSAGIANNDGSVWQGSVHGGGSPIMLASNQPSPYAIVVDATSVYWVNTGVLGGDNLPALNSGSVMKAPIGGGSLTTVASAQGAPISIGIAHGTLVWTEYGLAEPGLLMSAPTDGGTPVPLVAGLNDPGALALYGNTVFWGNANSSETNGSISTFSPF